ncbi:MAG: uroporphyrinogen-III synthase [Alphaproteobacteria bacterium]|nr:uroporphyrinogen-III synthase [Alphaproteobacteria bacterium]
MRLLITRPEEDAAPLAQQLEAAGHQCLIEPLLIIDFPEPPVLGLDQVQAVLLTSANGARALAKATKRYELLILAVGEATAAAAREAGFSNIGTAAGDVEALIQLVQIMLPQGAPLLHVAGSVTRGRLAERLRELGYDARREVLYEARAVEALSGRAFQAIKQQSLDGVLLFSPRTAKLFVRLLETHGLLQAIRGVQAYCLSRAVAEELAGLPFSACHIAEAPTQQALIELIG